MIPHIDYSACNGCGACAELYPLFFVIKDDKAWLINHEEFVFEKHKGVAYCCPFGAIILE
ncbi:MAG TPA: ferredoxin [Thermodesulfovibrionales bacterium]|nr:ferredoxin [Thermodesulfovibrionales bacterium]